MSVYHDDYVTDGMRTKEEITGTFYHLYKLKRNAWCYLDLNAFIVSGKF